MSVENLIEPVQDAERPGSERDGAGSRLEREFRNRLATDPRILDFLQGGVLDGMWFWDLENPDDEWMSDAFWEALGHDPRTKASSPSAWQDLIDPDDLAVAQANFRRHLINPDHRYDQIVRYKRPDGATAWIRCRGLALRDENGRPVRMIGVHSDVTELKRRENALSRVAASLEEAQTRAERQMLIDPLTGLANRRGLDRWIASSQGSARAVLHIDLDRFKTINDLYGHAAGDRALRHAAAALRAVADPRDLVARIGGDEFVVATTCRGACEGAADLAQRLVDRLGKSFEFDDRTLSISGCIGVACDLEGDLPMGELLKNADAALHQAKAKGLGGVVRFTEEMQRERAQRRRIAEGLLLDLETDAITPFYQPQICAETGAVVGVEALARWRRRGPDGDTILPPAAFLGVAEELRVLERIDATILRRALFDLARLEATGRAAPRVAVNVSARRLLQPGFIDEIERIAPAPGKLTVELVESIFFDEAGRDGDPAQSVERLRALGVEIELDDFGSGHASLIALTRLRPTRLKIDRRLIMPIVECGQTRALVRSILDIARTLSVECVAEGVETADHVALLREMGCAVLQGYHFARPMPFEDLVEYLSAAEAEVA